MSKYRPLSRRWLVLGGALLATFVAAVWPHGEEGSSREVVAPLTRSAEPRVKIDRTSTAASDLPLLGDRLERSQAVNNVKDLFAPKAWDAPASKSKSSVPIAPIAPSAPPFPYTIAGALADASATTVVFAKQNQNFVLKVGEILDDTYRVDEIGVEQVTVTYLPLGVKQVVPMGAPR